MIRLLIVSLFLSSAAMAETTKIVLTSKNTVTLSDAVEGRSVANVLDKAYRLSALLPTNDPLYLVLDTPGGSVIYGLQMIEALKSLPRPVHTITLFAASMGFHTAQALSTRYVLENGILMSHKASGGVRGEFPGQANVRLEFWTRMVSKMDERVVERTNGKYTLEQYQTLIDNEYWCSGVDCIASGFADEVASITCDTSLFSATKNNCPLVPEISIGFFGDYKDRAFILTK